jgi:hypothetical protein
MFGNSFQDSGKLSKRRFLVKNFLISHLNNSNPVILSKVDDDLFFVEESLQVVELRVVNVEDFILENFSF